MSAHLSSSARRTEARPVGYRSLASERCFRATSRRRTTLRSPNSRLGRGNVDRHRDRGNDDEIVHALAVHRAECADDQLCERGQERTRQEQPKSRSAPPRHPRTGPRKLEAKSRILFKLPHAERFSNVRGRRYLVAPFLLSSASGIAARLSSGLDKLLRLARAVAQAHASAARRACSSLSSVMRSSPSSSGSPLRTYSRVSRIAPSMSPRFARAFEKFQWTSASAGLSSIAL